MGIEENLHRNITHESYKYNNKLFDDWLPKMICREFLEIPPVEKGNFRCLSDEFIKKKAEAWIGPLIIGGISLIISIMYIYILYNKGSMPFIPYLIFVVSTTLVILCAVYLFTMPKKEIIFNRLQGTITFPGWWWKKNITMRFADMKFGYTTGGSNGIGGYQLQILRPDRIGTFEFFPMGSGNCYQDLSFITWYMDKNRPLPPGDAFVEFREKDFQRRKAEGFPEPLYPSEIDTPEMNKNHTQEKLAYQWKNRSKTGKFGSKKKKKSE